MKQIILHRNNSHLTAIWNSHLEYQSNFKVLHVNLLTHLTPIEKKKKVLKPLKHEYIEYFLMILNLFNSKV